MKTDDTRARDPMRHPTSQSAARPMHAAAADADNRLWTWPFVFALLSVLLFYGSFYLTLVALPKYLKDHLGSGAAQIGLITGLFSVAAMVPRPYVGRVADRGSALRPMILATCIFVPASALYIGATTIPRLILVRLFHGSGMACYTTAAPTLIAAIAPPSRRAEAMGFWGMANTIALALFPPLGLYLAGRWSYPVVFATASVISVVSVLVTILIRPRHPAPVSPALPQPGAWFERRVLWPALIGVVLAMSYNIVLSFTALLADERHIAGAGFFFTVFAAALFTYRIVGRRLADRRGRWATIILGYCCMGAGMIVASLVHSFLGLALLGVLTGIGFGAAQPALLALTVDLVPVARRGVAMASFYVAWEIGAATSSIVLGAVAQALTYGGMYAISGTLLLATVVLLLARSRRTRRMSINASTPETEND